MLTERDAQSFLFSNDYAILTNFAHIKKSACGHGIGWAKRMPLVRVPTKHKKFLTCCGAIFISFPITSIVSLTRR
jgi:hypothetical protein